MRQNGGDQRLATIRDPHRRILSRVRCIALFGVPWLKDIDGRSDFEDHLFHHIKRHARDLYPINIGSVCPLAGDEFILEPGLKMPELQPVRSLAWVNRGLGDTLTYDDAIWLSNWWMVRYFPKDVR